MDEKKEIFNYTYSASQQKEIMNIREKYAPAASAGEDDKMEQLRRLDRSATRTATVVSLTTGIISLLLLGVGMCCTMVWPSILFIPGIFIGIIGIAGMIATYPVYTRITKKQREKLAPEILRLSDELMK